MNRIKRIQSAAAVAVALTTVAACKPGQQEPTDSVEKVSVITASNIAIVEQGKLESGPIISGNLVPEHEATLRAEISGPVISTTVDQGERVARGAAMARLDDAEIEVAFLSARSAMTAAENSAAVAKREEERVQALVTAGALSERDLDQAKRANIGAQAQLADTKARLALAEKQRNATRITAPFAGVVTEKHVSAGDVVQPGLALFTIMDPSTMRLEASVPAEQLQLVKMGATVRFTVSGYGERQFSGRVTRINSAADPATGQVRIFVSVPNTGQSLVSGLFAEGRIATDSRDAMLAPTTAVNTSAVVPFVMRVKGGRVEKAEVKVGALDPATERVELLSGVAAGDTLLLGSAQGLQAGAAVRMSTGDAGSRTGPPR